MSTQITSSKWYSIIHQSIHHPTEELSHGEQNKTKKGSSSITRYDQLLWITKSLHQNDTVAVDIQHKW